MEGRTQLIIDGVEVVLPENFATTVKRENSFFTKNGEYTYDCTLSLDNDKNKRLYGFLQRLNKTDEVRSKRSAVLIADGKVYCRGTEVITGWTDSEVSVQIVSGNSELNYFIGDSLKIEWLDLGSISTISGITAASTYPQWDFCLATVRSPEGNVYNQYTANGFFGGANIGDALQGSLVRPQPFLCALLKRLIEALGYTLGENQLEDTQFKYLFLVNTIRTPEYAKMLPGWTVREFLQEVENMCGVVFITDNINKTVDILQKATYYANARQYPLRNVVDQYELTVEEDGDAEFTNSDVNYDMPDHYWSKLMRLADGALESAVQATFSSLADLIAYADKAGKILKDTSTGRYYIQVSREGSASSSSGGTFGGNGSEGGGSGEANESTVEYLVEIDQFCDLKREDSTGTLSLKMTPAPIAFIRQLYGGEVIDLCGKEPGDGSSSSESQDADSDLESTFRNFEKSEASAIDLYCAFHNGSYVYGPLAYTDAYHATIQFSLLPHNLTIHGTPVGSLRLKDIEDEIYAGVYRVDTKKQVVFETFDANMADPRGVFVIGNRRYVCREVEETISAHGRKPRWKMTCHPIALSDTAAEQRWVLTRGVWDDGGAWLDDGRWND